MLLLTVVSPEPIVPRQSRMRSPTIPATTPPPDRSFRDVTESRKAAEELRESQHLLELFFSQSLDGFFFMMLDTPMMWEARTDKETALDYVFAHERITKINAAMLAQYGALEEELIGRTPGDLMAQDIPAARARWRVRGDRQPRVLRRGAGLAGSHAEPRLGCAAQSSHRGRA